jgi:hypothetical protein
VGIPVGCVTNSYTIGGSVTGLAAGSLVLEDNGGDDLSVSANGSFTFATAIVSGATYDVTVASQPTGLTCSVSNASGSVSASNVNRRDSERPVAILISTTVPHCSITVRALLAAVTRR